MPPARAALGHRSAPSARVHTQWGRHECPDTHIQQVSGYVMSAHHGHQRTEFICVDPKFERHPWGGTDNQDHSLLYSVEIECGNPLLCGSPGYTQNHEVTCSICTKPLLIEGEA